VRINSDSNSNYALNKLSENSTLLLSSLSRISSGKKITTAVDDPAGLAQISKLKNQNIRIDSAINNNQNLLSFLYTQDSLLEKAVKASKRLSELSVLYNDITKNKSDKNNYKLEYDAILQSVQELSEKKYNGVSLFSGESMQTIIDESGNVRELTGINLKEAFKTNWGLNFNGVDDYGDIPNLTIDSSKYTIELKLGENTSGTAIGLMDSASMKNHFLLDTNWKNNISVWMTEGEVLTENAINDEYSISITADSSNGINTVLKAYQNGNYIATNTSASSIMNNLHTNHDWTIGQDWDVNTRTDYFSGTIHEIRIWDDIRTDEEISENFEKRLSGNEENLIGYWDFDSLSPEVDKSNNSNDIILNGTSWIDTTSNEGAGPSSFSRIENNLGQLRAIVGSRIASTRRNINMLLESKQNLSSAISTIENVDLATEATNHAKNKILQMSGIQALDISNIVSENILKLIYHLAVLIYLQSS